MRLGAALFAYVNRCPPMGLRLDDLHDRILSGDGRRLICSAHNAAFAVTTGQTVRRLPPECGLRSVAVMTNEAGEVVIRPG